MGWWCGDQVTAPYTVHLIAQMRGHAVVVGDQHDALAGGAQSIKDCDELLGTPGMSQRACDLATSTMAAVMAIVFLWAGRGALLTALLVACLLGCGSFSVRSAMGVARSRRRLVWADEAPSLIMTVSMVAMLVVM